MEEEKKAKSRVFEVQCPCCAALLWIDLENQQVIRYEKPKKEKGSLDDLLLKERRRKSEFDRKFEATAELEKERWKKAQEKFDKAISGLKKE